MHTSLLSQVSQFLPGLNCLEPSGEDEIRMFLKTADGTYSRHSHIVPVGLAAGVPDHAAVVDTTAVVGDIDPELAHACEHPEAWLLPSS